MKTVNSVNWQEINVMYFHAVPTKRAILFKQQFTCEVLYLGCISNMFHAQLNLSMTIGLLYFLLLSIKKFNQ